MKLTLSLPQFRKLGFLISEVNLYVSLLKIPLMLNFKPVNSFIIQLFVSVCLRMTSG